MTSLHMLLRRELQAPSLPWFPECEAITQKDERCRREAAYDVAGITLCRQHAKASIDKIITSLTWAIEAFHQEERDRDAEERRALRQRNRVYFMQREDGRIKIGRTTDLARRKRQLEREHGPLQLLVDIQAPPEQEKALHAEFHELWVEGEWFEPGDPLVAHIEQIKIKQAERAA